MGRCTNTLFPNYYCKIISRIAMTAFFCCFKCCWNGTGVQAGHVRLKELPSVSMDTSNMGSEVVIVKSGRRICGTGAALANAPIAQDKAYFELKLQSSGVWGVGLATRKVNLDTVPLGTTTESWIIRNDATVYHNNQLVHKLNSPIVEGDVIGLTYDHVELNIYLNGSPLHCTVTGIKGKVYPVVYVDEGAIVDVQFNEFYHQVPSGFDRIMFEKSLL